MNITVAVSKVVNEIFNNKIVVAEVEMFIKMQLKKDKKYNIVTRGNK